MEPDQIKEKIQSQVQRYEHLYRFDQREFGKVMIVASLALLVVSVHALFTISGAVEQASNSTERLETTGALLETQAFRNSLQTLAATGATTQNGESLDQVIADVEYLTQSLNSINELETELKEAQKTYQWTVLISLLGLVTGITSIYI